MKKVLLWILPAVTVLSLLPGCAASREIYYNAWSKVGQDRRDIFVSRVKSARGAENDAKEDFRTTLEKFQDIAGAKGDMQLETKYKKLQASYDSCKARADKVTDKIQAVENVANSMWAEWAKENTQFSDPAKKAENEKLLGETKLKYEKLLGSMRSSETKMKPVLAKFNDVVLDLKHKLDASAVASLQGTAVQIDTDVKSLIKDMEANIAEADDFIKNMK